MKIPTVPEYTPTIMDGAVLRWKFDCNSEVSASRAGVCLRLPETYGPGSIESIKSLLDTATEAHRKIAARGHDAAQEIVESLSRSPRPEGKP